MLRLPLKVLFVSAFTIAGCWSEQAFDVEAVSVALAHARDVAPEGRLLVYDEGTLDRPPDAPAIPDIAEAAERAGLEYGSVWEAMDCDERRCRGKPGFGGVVDIWSYTPMTADSVVMGVRVLVFNDEIPYVYEQGDEVHVAQDGEGSWRIVKVVRVSES
jgi:nucleotide-binding universal stress UspA family protein